MSSWPELQSCQHALSISAFTACKLIFEEAPVQRSKDMVVPAVLIPKQAHRVSTSCHRQELTL
jgi:hypothetical protein